MAVDAIVKDGAIQETASQSSVQKAASSDNGMGKDAFLQLLVAQMKYQDPLQPTSNTEYISQYATFSQVEQMQNMAATMELTRASSMVGKLVSVESINSAGETSRVEGVVEYVSYENNKAYVSIDGTLFSADDVIAVIDENFYMADELAANFMTAINDLPSLEALTLEDKEDVEALQEIFNGMTSYEQSFINKTYVEALQAYVERMAVLVEEKEEADAENAEGEGDTEEGAVTGAGEVTGTENSEAQTGNTETAGSAELTESTEATGSNGNDGETEATGAETSEGEVTETE